MKQYQSSYQGAMQHKSGISGSVGYAFKLTKSGVNQKPMIVVIFGHHILETHKSWISPSIAKCISQNCVLPLDGIEMRKETHNRVI